MPNKFFPENIYSDKFSIKCLHVEMEIRARGLRTVKNFCLWTIVNDTMYTDAMFGEKERRISLAHVTGFLKKVSDERNALIIC